MGNHDTHAFADDEVSFDSISNLRQDQSLRDKGWVVVDTWTTRMSEDNECGFYCEHPDGHYYTIGITNRNVVKIIAVLTFSFFFFYDVPFLIFSKALIAVRGFANILFLSVCKTQKS